ncbi:putative chromatin remodeling & transcription regulator FYR family [Helianthus annuus]|nr:putative chromatin remodeling & transcription regulator FYR family [Helianthus annuus]KAJ0638300.1 putative chromatin remodeling & transcription regulator FYR family [Helianthus annuus]KAJ0815528.1 putative chromatin remodeling & transcription regulator FYR family [Helianthus annuus]KAJ0828873.1 putative chromatin remodeling & transcription regulator FYR family [Helianthus annuus]
MKEQIIADEKSDGLDIVSIGKLYEGAWEKKYWSSSRGKDRYPYPVGYVALRANNGNTYKMAIFEGLKGPEFVISSTDGQSCSGQTPDIAWEGFQKKSSVRIKFKRGKRFSCKIDGAELFGFKNPHVMRLLRGLKANVSQITPKDSPSLSFGNGQPEGTHEHHTKHPDLQVNLVKSQGKEKKSNKRKENNVKSVSGPGPKRERPPDLTQGGHEPHCRGTFEENHNKGVLSSSSSLNENNTSHLVSTEEGMQVDSVILSDHREKEKCLSVQEAITEEGAKLLKGQENHDLSMLSRTPGFTSSKTVDVKGDPPPQKESKMLDDVDLYAPDTLDITLDSACNLEVEIPKESTCTFNDKLNSTQILVSEKCVTDSYSEKSDSDPVGHEISDSMMALLLPRALPLLKTFSRKKKKNIDGMFQKRSKEVDQYPKDEPPAKSSEHLEKLSGEVHTPDQPSTVNFTLEKQNESVLLASTSTDSVVPGLEDSTTVAPDSFENGQFEVVDCSVQDAVKADQNTSSIDLCIREGLDDEVEVSVGSVSSMLTVDASVSPHQEADGLISVLQGQRKNQHDKTKTVHSGEEAKVVRNDELENIFELVGCYMLPTPISMTRLRTKGDEVFVCVLCGYLMENERTLFIYKVSGKEETRGCPSFIGHTRIISLTSRNASGRQVPLDRTSLQLTPDGKSLVLLNSIKAPYCREGSVNCGCSMCTSDCFENNAVKIVQVKLGYVQVVCKLQTTNDVCCMLVCEPSYLVASEESGTMNLWTMNSSWSAPTDQSYLSTSDCMPNCIVEMKRIPNFPALIIGHGAYGDFYLWDLTRRTLVSKFSAPRTSSQPFIPISLYRYPTQALSTSDACRKKQVEDIMEETQRWSLETDNHDSLPVNEEDLSVVLLVSFVSDFDLFDEYSRKDSGVSPAGSWSLALLAKNKLVSENALDPSATVVGASSGYGIIGTRDGSLYIWELSTGTKLGYLSHCTGATVSCLAADDSDSGVFAVTVDGNQLLVYAPVSLANKKHE